MSVEVLFGNLLTTGKSGLERRGRPEAQRCILRKKATEKRRKPAGEQRQGANRGRIRAGEASEQVRRRTPPGSGVKSVRTALRRPGAPTITGTRAFASNKAPQNGALLLARNPASPWLSFSRACRGKRFVVPAVQLVLTRLKITLPAQQPRNTAAKRGR